MVSVAYGSLQHQRPTQTMKFAILQKLIEVGLKLNLEINFQDHWTLNQNVQFLGLRISQQNKIESLHDRFDAHFSIC